MSSKYISHLNRRKAFALKRLEMHSIFSRMVIFFIVELSYWGQALEPSNRSYFVSGLGFFSSQEETLDLFVLAIQMAISNLNYICEKLQEGWFDWLTCQCCSKIIHYILGSLLNQDIVLALPSIVDIIIAVQCSHLAISWEAMSTHHLATLSNRFSGSPSSLCF